MFGGRCSLVLHRDCGELDGGYTAQVTTRFLRRGAAWLLTALIACGSERTPDPSSPIRQEPDAGGSPPASPTRSEPDAGGSPASVDADASAPPLGIADEDGVRSNGVATSDVLGQRVLALLEQHCSSCLIDPDGPGEAVAAVSLSRLIESGQIVPGSSTSSPVFQSIQLAPYPPGDPRSPPFAGELALIARFIDGLPSSVPECAPLPFVSIDQALELMAADSQTLSADDLPFARYVTLTDASNATLCGLALERQRQALFEAINGASLAGDIALPVAIDEGALIYRLDLRAYAWNRALDLDEDGAADFADGWQAASAAAGAYAVSHAGPEADGLVTALQTPVPFLPAQVLVHAVAAGDLYYSLIGMGRVIDETMLALGLDVITALSEDTAQLASFAARGREVRVLRLAQSQSDRAWWSIDDENSSDSGSPFESPIDYDGWQAQAIFHLPNGLQAYVSSSIDGRANAVVSHRYCGPCEAFEALPLAACPACHGGGLLPVVDEVRAYVERNQSQFDQDTFGAVLAQYPTADELDALLQRDSDIHRAALARALVPAVGSDPLSRVYFQFERAGLDLRRAAGELGVPPEVLDEKLPTLDPRLAPLQSGGSVDRATFTSIFGTARCQLHANARNRVAGCP